MSAESNFSLKSLAGSSSIYALGIVAQRLTGLIMLPIYTRYLTPADYGVLSLLEMVIVFSGILIGLRMSQALFRFVILSDDPHEKDRIVSTVMCAMLIGSLVGSIFLLLGSEVITIAVFGDLSYLGVFQVYCFTLATTAVTTVGLSYLRVLRKPKLFVSINIATLLLQVLLNVVFIVILELGVLGVAYASLSSGFLVAVAMFVFVIMKVGIRVSRRVLAKLVRYAYPLILASLGAFYAAYADKYFIRLFVGLSEVGLYSLAAKLATLLVTGYEAFNLSWAADRFEIAKHENAREIFDRVFRYLSAFLVVTATCIVVFTGDLLNLMTDPKFNPAEALVPPLVLAALFSVLTIFCNFGAHWSSRTGIIAYAEWVKAAVATVGYVLLIPKFGALGAAGALAAAGLINLLWIYFKSKKEYDMGLTWKPLITFILMAATASYFGSLMPSGERIYLLFRILIILALVIAIFLAPAWPQSERMVMISSLKSGFGMLRAFVRLR